MGPHTVPPLTKCEGDCDDSDSVRLVEWMECESVRLVEEINCDGVRLVEEIDCESDWSLVYRGGRVN